MHITTYLPSQITYDIRSLKKADYIQGIDEFLQSFQNRFVGKVAVYQFGQEEAPGISDIDLLIVVQDKDWRHAIHCAQQAIHHSERLLYLFVHSPLVVCNSLVESLAYLHTLENLHPVSDGWDPLEHILPKEMDEHSRLMRHAVWNSFIRISALELEGKTIGMRRALTLAHNLYLTALNGNRLLRDPLIITLDSNEIRREILEASQEQGDGLAKEFLREVLHTLRKVDERLSEELNLSSDFTEAQAWMFVHRHRFILPYQAEMALRDRSFHRFLQSTRLIFVPDYLLALTSLLMHRSTPHNHRIAFLQNLPFPKDLAKRFPLTMYEHHFTKSLILSQHYHLPYPFILPFSPRDSTSPWRKRLSETVQRKLLEGMLKTYASSNNPS